MNMKSSLNPLFVLLLCAHALCAGALGGCTAELADPGGMPGSAGDIDDNSDDFSDDNGTPGHALALPPSLQGTEPDGALHLDQHGRFVADADAMRFFDYFLTAEGEMPQHALYALVHEAIAHRLPAAAAAQASESFERYQDYRAEVARIVGDRDQTAAHARDRLLRLHGERVAHMPGLAADPILFNRAAALHRVLVQPGLDRDLRAARIAEIHTAMPVPGHDRVPLAQDQADQAHLLQRLRQAEQRLRARGGSATELHALRADLVGPAAAERLARLDRARTAWQQRVMEYRRACAAARAASAAPDAASTGSADPSAARPALEPERFTARERLRLRAYLPSDWPADLTAGCPAR